MRLSYRPATVFAITAFMAVFAADAVAQELGGATIRTAAIDVNDLAYDSTRNRLYGTVPGSAGAPYGNSVVVINPDTLSVERSFFIGSDPNKLVVSNDGRRLYVGLDGARAVVAYDLVAGATVFQRPINSFFGDPAVVEDMAVSPSFPNTVITVNDEIGSTADGDLEVHQGSGSALVGGSEGWFDNNRIDFDDGDTMLAFNNSNTGFDLKRWRFDGEQLTFEQSRGSAVSQFGNDIEAAGGRVTFTSGIVYDVATLQSLGTFSGAGGDVEPMPDLGFTYFYNNGTLRAFDDDTFLLADSVTLSGPSSLELLTAGYNRLAVLSGNSIAIIDNVPVVVPEPTGLALVALTGVGLLRRRRIGRPANKTPSGV